MKRLACKIILSLIILAYGIMPLAQAAGTAFETISAERSAALIEKHKGNSNFVIVDVRTPQEFKVGHIEDSALIDYYSKNYLKELNALDKNKTYLIYCRSGNRSLRTLGMIKEMGFKKVYNIDRGLIGWHAGGYRTVN